MTTFTQKDLKTGKRRCGKATEGPWFTRRTLGCKDIGPKRKGYQRGLEAVAYTVGMEEKEDAANAAFIIHVRTYYPLALDALGEAWVKLGRIQDMCDFIIKEHEPLDMIRRRFEQVQEILGATKEG